MWKNFIGSMLACLLALGLWSNQYQDTMLITDEGWDNSIVHLYIIFGTLAYVSRKRVKLGLSSGGFVKWVRLSAEIFIIFIIIFSNFFLIPNAKARIALAPETNLLIPVWIFVAYLYVLLKKPKNVFHEKPLSAVRSSGGNQVL